MCPMCVHIVVERYQYCSKLPDCWTCSWPFLYFQSGNPGTVSNTIDDRFVLAQGILFFLVLDKNINPKLSAGRDSKRRKTYNFHEEGKRIIFLSCPTSNAVPPSAMPASRFSRRATLGVILQPCIKGIKWIFCPK